MARNLSVKSSLRAPREPRDLRIKAAVRAPREAASSDGEGLSNDSRSAVSSDEEWVDSASDTSTTTSTSTSQSKQGRSEGLSHPRSSGGEAGEDHEVEVLAPPLGRREFTSWEDLETYLAGYTQRTYQSFRHRTNNTMAARNVKIRESSPTKPLLPETWVNYGKMYTCTHAETYKTRGKGKRKRLQSRTMECGAQINACV
ncbi:hypothetical protein PF008_g8617 [Phytophthora fragariae]|uniref:Uncharacterized protein n=1 Tax=Phytophthora fragariae TaxID=53985 RepID=A0A6G0S0M1_9STRA|nr:hypothetical protein PF008_g8617 [Phytophthora fragariae]